MSKYFVELQTPSVELAIESIDSSNRKITLDVGFKRYDSDETKLKRDEYFELSKESRDLAERMKDKYDSQKIIDGEVYPAGELLEKGEVIDQSLIDEVEARLTKATIKFIKDNVVYIKRFKLVDADGNELLSIKDTRTFDKKEIWEGEGFSNCLDFVLSLYMASNLWRGAFLNGVFKALINVGESKKAAGKN